MHAHTYTHMYTHMHTHTQTHTHHTQAQYLQCILVRSDHAQLGILLNVSVNVVRGDRNIRSICYEGVAAPAVLRGEGDREGEA